MKCLVLNRQAQTEERSVTRNDLVQAFSLYARDLRPVITSRQLITILPHRQAIVLNLGVLKMILGSDEVFVFNINNPEVSEQFLEKLSTAVQQMPPKQSFVFVVLEAALNHKFNRLRTEFETLEAKIESLLVQLEKSFNDKNLEKLLRYKKRLNKFDGRIKEVEEMLVDLIDDEDELEQFYFSFSERPEYNSEIESILEFFSQPAEEMSNKLNELKETIDDTQEFISMKLQNRRNIIIRFDLLATLVTAVFSFLAVITGIYGMNLKNFAETSDIAFGFVIGGLIITLIGSIIWLWRILKQNNIF